MLAAGWFFTLHTVQRSPCSFLAFSKRQASPGCRVVTAGRPYRGHISTAILSSGPVLGYIAAYFPLLCQIIFK